MPVRVAKVKGGKYQVKTPGGVKAKGTTKAKAAAQQRLLNALEHNPGWKPTGKKAAPKASTGMHKMPSGKMMSRAQMKKHMKKG